ncbi:hypothetical protein [Azospirillum lipoferum]|uniref:Uncharacterized protein n=1 Tax=Azospirillum lipoferum (strain 4B) TaxID=862719 RepID=G7Z3Q5_AZOL4|nr:hypothetical protein [Azospirillum lipoferum]CBS88063.1 protein of unknown function [Azospirillum lipoferum 4B]
MVRNKQLRDEMMLCFQGSPTGHESSDSRDDCGSSAPTLVRPSKPLKAQTLVLRKRSPRSIPDGSPAIPPGYRLATREELYDTGRGHFDPSEVSVCPPQSREEIEALDRVVAMLEAQLR